MPAYGRDYKSKKAAQADLDAGKDFMTPSGQYISINELREIGKRTIRCRYKKLTMTAVLEVRDAK